MPKRRGRGEGSISQLPSGNWRAVVVVGTVNSRKSRLSATFPSKSEALDWLRDRQKERKDGRLSASRITLTDYLDEWIKRRAPTVAPASAAYYLIQVDKLKGSQLAHLPLRRLTRPTIEDAIVQIGTVDQNRKALDLLRIVLNDAVEDGLVPRNVASMARKPKAETKTVQFWTAEEVTKILDAASDSWISALFWIAFDSGMRPGEMLGIHWQDVDTVAGTIRVTRSLEDIRGQIRLKEPKTAKGRRTIRISRETCEAIEVHRGSMKSHDLTVLSGPMFVGRRTGELMTHSTFYAKYYNPVVRAAGVTFYRPYAMRHTCATLLLAAGVSIKVVAERLGHEDITTTLKHYVHLLPDAQESAAVAIGKIIAGAKAPCPTHEQSEQPSTDQKQLEK